MPNIEPSQKLFFGQEQYRICSGRHVFFRVITSGNCFKLMTATASENTIDRFAFGDQEALFAAATQVFADCEMEMVIKDDHAGRPYVETNVSHAFADLLHIATTILDRLGIDDLAVEALRNIKDLHEEFALDDSDNDVYWSDGIYSTPGGRLVER